ncbi:MAG: hypothetical protein Q8O72_17680 [Bacteroidales bacterium]|nr:hypothetical protein [Bacteroidales bacterium]
MPTAFGYSINNKYLEMKEYLIDMQSDKSGCNGCTFNMFIVEE